MKINFKNILIADALIIALIVTFFFNGQKISDMLTFAPEKQTYKTFLTEIERLIDQAGSLDQNALNKRINDINVNFIDHSEWLYGVKLDGTSDSVDNLERVFKETNVQHVYQGEFTLFDFYMGEIIKAKTNSQWIFGADDRFYLESQKNHEKLTSHSFIIDQYYGGTDESVQTYIDKSISKLGGQK